MFHCGMRQMEERHVANQVDLMVWSNRLDLLALSNFKGDVQIHRLHWQKVLILPPPNENDKVRAMTWRPDGKALAIGYESGSVYIADIEDKEILDEYILIQQPMDEIDSETSLGITCMTWPVKSGQLSQISDDADFYSDSSLFLPKIPTAPSTYKNPTQDDKTKQFKEIQEQTQLNILLVGYGDGNIDMRIFGRFPFGILKLAQVFEEERNGYKVLDINLSEDFSSMQILYYDTIYHSVHAAVIDTSVLTAYADEVFKIANKHSQVVQLLSYLDQTMVSINEAWEHILLEMDTKMADYAASVPDGGVSADFLELLLMGVPSDELELFLLQELTAKGLKKFGSSVELSYSTIQKLVLRQLNVVGQSLVYHLAELRGLTRVPNRYKIMGLEENVVTEAIQASFAFLNKCLELQQVIDVSMRNYKTFFRWLLVVIVRLLDEQTPSEIVKITQQDLAHIAEFLYNFDNNKGTSDESTEKPVRFNLERLGQYLQNQDLQMLPDDDDSPWHNFLSENACQLKETETIFPVEKFKKFSLVQQQEYLKQSLKKVFDVADKDVGADFTVTHNFKCFEDSTGSILADDLRFSQWHDSEEDNLIVAIINSKKTDEGLYFMSINSSCDTVTAKKYYFSPSLIQSSQDEKRNDSPLKILDLQFYSNSYLSVLISHPTFEDSCVFVQVPITIAMEHLNELHVDSKSCIFGEKLSKRDLSPLLEQGVFKVLDKMDGYQIAVSGGRKVAVVLSKTRRKVRVYEMEIDGDDEDDITPLSHNSTQKSDNSAVSLGPGPSNINTTVTELDSPIK